MSWRSRFRHARTVDIAARRTAAELLERLAAGELTNDEFEERFPFRSRDPALLPVFWMADEFCDERRTHTLTGPDGLDNERRELLRRCVRFLRTEQPYAWSSWTDGVAARLILLPLGLVTLGLLPWLLMRLEHARVDESVWPFGSRELAEASLAIESSPVTPPRH